ncbi:hypothetical protein BACCAP_04237 [Pseudoflavonifractor capillosus ATCC 29799]|uniref:Uncharacterized protein n=1 Tax=Pseudoflavonifractor capillosus ATCC 29799 TaxID=411467 RepID=A6P170_9FIRM|nr:hypothetical protein BACCAP_04237 [Pseudoflavonifractor capillosus ATCC 29799]
MPQRLFSYTAHSIFTGLPSVVGSPQYRHSSSPFA